MAESNNLIELAARGDECILLHDSLLSDQEEKPASGRGSVLFTNPVRTITCWDGGKIEASFSAIERALAEGLYVAGAFAYELGYHLEEKLAPLAPEAGEPLFQLGVFRTMTRLNPNDVDAEIAIRTQNPPGDPQVDGSLQYHLNRGDYDTIMVRLHDYILAGDIYQANFTFPLKFPWSGDVWQLYGAVAPFQKVAFGAVVDLPDYKLASLSPELFFRKLGNAIESRPMKGTMRRGNTFDEDASLQELLHNDPKNRAENLMIVDLIRNDLGRMARIGSVTVENLFQVETYGTLHQMVSTVRAEVAGEPTVREIFQHLFPCGSVTGAPKIRAMEIIAELESGPRGIYTGAIGYVTPSRDMCMSVPIRTMSLNHKCTVTMGIGSGVVADSSAVGEYEECLLKARFLNRAFAYEEDGALSREEERPGLIETMRSADGVIALLDDHRARLAKSADHLGIVLAAEEVWNAVADHAASFTEDRRIRLQLEAGGTWRIESAPIPEVSDKLPVVVMASDRLRSDDPLLAHKTTRRTVFDQARTILEGVEDGFDVLLFNERGELCEGAIGNVFLLLDNELATPALSCGLLPGVMRARVILEQGAHERVLYEEDLRRAEKVYLSNAVRGLMEVHFRSNPSH